MGGPGSGRRPGSGRKSERSSQTRHKGVVKTKKGTGAAFIHDVFSGKGTQVYRGVVDRKKRPGVSVQKVFSVPKSKGGYGKYGKGQR
jgi:hypothetical protein